MKQKRFKSILVFLLVLCMVFGMQASIVFAEGNNGSVATMSGNCGATEKDNVKWNLVQNNEGSGNPTYTLTISGTGAMANLNTSTETENSTSGNSSYPWSEYSNNITRIVVEDGVTSIGSKAFIAYKNVASVEIGKDVSEIGVAALSQLSACTKFDVSRNNSFTTDREHPKVCVNLQTDVR